MDCLKKYEEYLDKFRKIYIITFITYLMLSRMVLFVNLITMNVNSLIYNLFACVGILLLVFDFLSNFYPFKSKENILLTGFLVTCGVSSLVNMSYGLTDNLKTLVWTAIQFYVLFSMLHIKSREEVYSNINTIMTLSSNIWFAGVVISLFQFVFQIKYRASFSAFSRRQGFYDARLFGIFSDPNFAAVTSVLVIMFCYYLRKNSEIKWKKRLYATNIICQGLYIILSGSRTGMLELVLLVVVLTFLEVRNKYVVKSAKNPVGKAIVRSISAGVLTAVIIVVLPVPLFKVAEGGKYLKTAIVGEGHGNSDKIETVRDDVTLDDISNNRFDIWISALEVSKDNRLIGLSPRNMVKYAEVNYPDSYIAKTEYQVHSGYVALIVNTGIIGFSLIIIFIVYILVMLTGYFIMQKKRVFEYGVIITFTTTLIIAVSAIPLLDIFFVNTYSAAIFWLFGGYMLYFVRNPKKAEV